MYIPTTALTQGGSWSAYTSVWTSDGTQPVVNNGTIVGRYTQIGKLVCAYVSLTMGTTTTFGTGNYFFSLPIVASSEAVGFGGNMGVLFNASPAGNGTSFGWVGGDPSVMTMYGLANTDAASAVNLISATHPWTWATGDIMRGMLTYEAA